MGVFRDPAYNVAYWNLPERVVRIDGDAVLVDGNPGRLFHFSGFDPDDAHAVTRYSRRLHMDNVGHAAALFRRYRALLHAAGYQRSRTWPYTYGRFDNGVPVPDRAREVYRDLGPAAERFGDPLATTSPDSFFEWLGRQGGNVLPPAAPRRRFLRWWK